MANTKEQWSEKINIEKKKKLVERKRKLISTSTGCNRVYPYMASQEVLLLEYGNVRISPRGNFYVRISTSCKQWLATCSLLVLYKKSSTRSSTTWATCRDKKIAVQTAASTADTRNEVSVTSELNRAFRIPRASTSATVQAILPLTVASIRAAANNFSATSNYGRTVRDSGRRGRSRSHNGRFQPYRSQRNQRLTRDAAEPSVFYKDVCLLDCPEWENVPLGEVKADLIRKNLYIDAWPVVKDWSAATLRQEIENLFECVLKNSSGNNVRWALRLYNNNTCNNNNNNKMCVFL